MCRNLVLAEDSAGVSSLKADTHAINCKPMCACFWTSKKQQKVTQVCFRSCILVYDLWWFENDNYHPCIINYLSTSKLTGFQCCCWHERGIMDWYLHLCAELENKQRTTASKDALPLLSLLRLPTTRAYLDSLDSSHSAATFTVRLCHRR